MWDNCIFLVSCTSSPPTVSNPFRPLSGFPNANVIGTVQINFEARVQNSTSSDIDRINEIAYQRLIEEAQKEYTGLIDICDITWVIVRQVRMSYNVCEIMATGRVISLDGGNRRTSTAAGIEGALERAAEDVAEDFSARSRIAIVYITAQDRSTTEYITGELEHILRRQGFIIIDRSELDRIRREQNFQMSGEVDDATAISLGRFSGANIFVTGRVDGEDNLRRLRLRALDTTSGQVVGTASERL